ncbi:hypothetical protein JB92DRAFT_2835453 [Gautieria morchelliformis]|nr:hypothetical protein JB92DRAFT_2835453 [Gautieria morchelliformis]
MNGALFNGQPGAKMRSVTIIVTLARFAFTSHLGRILSFWLASKAMLQYNHPGRSNIRTFSQKILQDHANRRFSLGKCICRIRNILYPGHQKPKKTAFGSPQLPPLYLEDVAARLFSLHGAISYAFRRSALICSHGTDDIRCHAQVRLLCCGNSLLSKVSQQ